MKKKKGKRLRNNNAMLAVKYDIHKLYPLGEPDPRKRASKDNDINIKKYKPQGSYRGDSPLDD